MDAEGENRIDCAIDQRPPWGFRNSPASEWALMVNMVTSIVRGVLDASVGKVYTY